MIRSSRAALLASCALALSACGTFHHASPASGSSAEAAKPAKPKRVLAKRDEAGAVPTVQVAKGKAPRADVWAQAYAGLPPDPAMRFGTLPNGLRYVVMKNATPTGQSSLRLRIG